jgi:hypothetical protein
VWLKRGGAEEWRRLDRSVLLRLLGALAVPPYQRVEDPHLTLKPSGRRLAAAAVAMALLAVTPPTYASASAAEAPPESDAVSHTITLITGDKVTVGPAGTTSVLGADGRGPEQGRGLLDRAHRRHH